MTSAQSPLRPGVNVFDHRIFFLRIKILGSADDTPDVRLAVARFGDEHLRRCQPDSFSSAMSASSSLQINLPSATRRSSLTGGASTRLKASIRYFPSGEYCTVIAIARRQRNETCSIKIDPVMEKIWSCSAFMPPA